MVHAYLMYGFPTETAQETIDALERVRQLFAEGCIQSAFWHRFAATAHSPIGKQPDALRHPAAHRAAGVDVRANELAFDDPTGCDHDALRRRAAQGALQLHARPRARRGRAQLVRARGREGDSAAARTRAPNGAGAAIPKPRVPAPISIRARR